MSAALVNLAWRPAVRRPSSGRPGFLKVEWEPERDQDFKLSPEERKAVRQGQKVLVKTR